jgi:arsenate reductase (thioredoxin)
MNRTDAQLDRPLGLPDPTAVVGTPEETVVGTLEEVERACRDNLSILDRRISLFLSLPLSTLGQPAIQRKSTR